MRSVREGVSACGQREGGRQRDNNWLYDPFGSGYSGLAAERFSLVSGCRAV